MNPTEQYLADRDERAAFNGTDRDTKVATTRFMDTIYQTDYVRNFFWMGRPILQLPTDLMALQEIIWDVKPDYIIETGVAFGGLTVFYASILNSVHWFKGSVISIDIDIRNHTRQDLLMHPLWEKIDLIEGDSTNPKIVKKVKSVMDSGKKIMVSLDSNHTHKHVLGELEAYGGMVSVGSYMVVMDTSIEWLDKKYIGDRPWGKGNSPWSAVQEWMKGRDGWIVDKGIEDRILLTSAPGGWLRRVK